MSPELKTFLTLVGFIWGFVLFVYLPIYFLLNALGVQ